MGDKLKRPRYFNGQFLREQDFNDEQFYHLEHQRDHDRLLHTAGIAEGLEVDDNPAQGALAIKITAGTGYDSSGRRIVLENDDTSMNVGSLPGNPASVFVVISYREAETDPNAETGVSGDVNTRWLEAPLIELLTAAPADATAKLVLGRVVIAGTAIDSIDGSMRRTAGVKGGDLAVRSLTFTSEAVPPTGWVPMRLAESGRAALTGSLSLTGDITLSATGRVDGRDVSADGTKLDNHTASTANPHSTTAAQVGALPAAGGTLSGNLQVNGNLGIGVAGAHRLFVLGGDEADNQTFGVVSQVNTGTAATNTTAFSGNVSSSGEGQVYGLNLSVFGGGAGVKYGVVCSVQGEGQKNAAQFSAYTASTTSAAYTQGIYVNANTAGTGSAQGLTASANAVTGGATGLSSNANSSGAGPATGLNAYASGDGAGQKTGIYSTATGADGGKVAGQFNASTTAAATTAYANGLNVNANASGGGYAYGMNVSAGGDNAGQKTGIACSAYGADGTKFCGQFNAYTSGNTSNAQTYGVYSVATTAGTGITYAGYFVAGANAAANATNTFGLFASASSAGSGASYGIYATVGGGTGTKYAGFFIGNVHVQGAISTSGPKPFYIDHPLDPYNKTLRHNAVESPEELCLYRGVVTLDGTGKGTVKMPDYFAALTTEEEATVVLTPIGKKPFAASYEWAKKFNAFAVFGEPDRQVSYIVLANRDDPAVRVLRRPVEEDKSKPERGKLLFPEGYGEPPEKGVAPPVPVAEAPVATIKELEKQRHDMQERMLREQKARDGEQKRMLEEQKSVDEKRRQKEAKFRGDEPKPRK